MKLRSPFNSTPLFFSTIISFVAGALIISGVLFLVFVFKNAEEMQSAHYDHGISVTSLIEIIESIEAEHPHSRIVFARTYFRSLEIRMESSTESSTPSVFIAYKSIGGWYWSPPPPPNPKGIALSEMKEILRLLQAEDDKGWYKSILTISVHDGKVEIQTGETNHNVGGEGYSIDFEKRNGKWVRTNWGWWVS